MTALWALSLWQPWASLMAIGEKLVETRSWLPDRVMMAPLPIADYIGETFALAATASQPREVFEAALADPVIAAALQRHGLWPAMDAARRNRSLLPQGAVLATARLVSVMRTKVIRDGLSAKERIFGDYTRGRYGWEFDRLERLAEPRPCTGAQGLWRWDPDAPPTARPAKGRAVDRQADMFGGGR